MFLKGAKLFVVIFQAVLIFHPKLTATHLSVQKQPEMIDQPITKEKCLHQISINVQDVPQEQLDVVELCVKSLDSIFGRVDYTKSSCARSSGNGVADQQEGKATEESWWKEKLVIPENLTDLCNYRYNPFPAVEVSSTSTSPYSQTSYNNTSQWPRSFVWSPADPLPWMSIDFKQTRKIYYFVMGIGGNYFSDTKGFKMLYGDEKKEGWNITGEKFFNTYSAKEDGTRGGDSLVKPHNFHFAEGRYFYIIRYPEDAQLDITSLACYGI